MATISGALPGGGRLAAAGAARCRTAPHHPRDHPSRRWSSTTD